MSVKLNVVSMERVNHLSIAQSAVKSINNVAKINAALTAYVHTLSSANITNVPVKHVKYKPNASLAFAKMVTVNQPKMIYCNAP